nr:LOW QUALITY PROTEIN: probable polypeptide N-acetylgalactosaminyltransferase 8 [Rattus norvegicus]
MAAHTYNPSPSKAARCFKRLLGFSVHSKICQQWGKGLSEAQQREAQDLFLEFGCSVFLSNQMPYNGSIPDTHNARCTGPQCSLVMNFGSHAKERVDRGLSYISSCIACTEEVLSWNANIREAQQLCSLPAMFLSFVSAYRIPCHAALCNLGPWEAPPIIERRHHQHHQPTPPQLLKIILVDDISSHGEDPEGRRRSFQYPKKKLSEIYDGDPRMSWGKALAYAICTLSQRSGAACRTVASPTGQCRTVYNFCIASIFLHAGLCWGGVWLGGELKDEKFQVYNQNYPILLRCLIRHTKRRGLAHDPNTGLEAATADVVAILDAPVDVNIGWTQNKDYMDSVESHARERETPFGNMDNFLPSLSKNGLHMTVRLIRASLSAPAHCGATVGLTVLSSFRAPVSDDINFDTFELKKDALAADGFVWKLWYHYDPSPRAWIDLGDASVPIRSPSFVGIVATNRIFLEEIGALDGGMLLCGGQNVGLGLRGEYFPSSLWVKAEGDVTKALRIWESYSTFASRKELWEKLKCKTFDWYLKIVMKNSLDGSVCLDGGPAPGNSPRMEPCHDFTVQVSPSHQHPSPKVVGLH